MPFTEIERQHDLFMQQSRTWVFCIAGLLALIAGYINVVMLGFFAIPVSHMSGAVSQLGIELGYIALGDVLLIISIIVGFFCGAFLSGLVLRKTKFEIRPRYGVLLLVEAALLVLSMWLALQGMQFAVPIAAMACGLQNAMASSYRGLTLRTTHVTGIVTDLGALLGNRLQGRQIQRWKFGLLLSLLAAFFIGALSGAVLLSVLGMWALSLAAGSCLIMGLVVVIRTVNRPQSKPSPDS